jgi:hypothetical protein
MNSADSLADFLLNVNASIQSIGIFFDSLSLSG